jgi:hypothetical protein
MDDWVEVLYGIIPEEKLMDSYLAAIRDPNRKPEDARFPLKVTELLDAFYKQRAAKTSDQPLECDFCRMHRYDPTQYPPCAFHSEKGN